MLWLSNGLLTLADNVLRLCAAALDKLNNSAPTVQRWRKTAVSGWCGLITRIMLVAQEIVKMYCEVSEDEFETWLDKNIPKLVEREMKQIVDAHNAGRNDRHNDFSRDGEQYYFEVSDSTCH